MMRVNVASQGTRMRREDNQSSYWLLLFNCFHRFYPENVEKIRPATIEQQPFKRGMKAKDNTIMEDKWIEYVFFCIITNHTVIPVSYLRRII
jgi:hypothetical protein